VGVEYPVTALPNFYGTRYYLGNG